jgi:valyl-tRNA synthetase
MRAPVDTVTVQGPADRLAAVETVSADLRATGSVRTLRLEESAGPELSIDVVLAAE